MSQEFRPAIPIPYDQVSGLVDDLFNVKVLDEGRCVLASRSQQESVLVCWRTKGGYAWFRRTAGNQVDDILGRLAELFDTPLLDTAEIESVQAKDLETTVLGAKPEEPEDDLEARIDAYLARLPKGFET